MDTSPRSDRMHSEFALNTVPARICNQELLDNPDLTRLLVEDACWTFAVSDWSARRPRPWHVRARREARIEYHELRNERARIARLARSCGVYGD
jgi:hypothetical protein